VIFQNAQGSPATALQIAQKFVSLNPKVIVPITTPSAQAAYAVAKGASIPVIFSAVSDPKSAKLYDETAPNPLIAGVSDLSPVRDQVTLIKKIFPDIQTICVLYNAGEANSLALINLFERDANSMGISVIRVTVATTNDVGAATMNCVGKADVIYIPNDNTVISAFESVINIAHRHKIAVFTADPESVTRGALGCIAYNQYDIGRKTGEMIVKHIIEHTPLDQLGVKHPDKMEMILNLKTAASLGLTIPQALIQAATFTIHD
jgi:putative ABC transport system substrate-binding protein